MLDRKNSQFFFIWKISWHISIKSYNKATQSGEICQKIEKFDVRPRIKWSVTIHQITHALSTLKVSNKTTLNNVINVIYSKFSYIHVFSLYTQWLCIDKIVNHYNVSSFKNIHRSLFSMFLRRLIFLRPWETHMINVALNPSQQLYIIIMYLTKCCRLLSWKLLKNMDKIE